MTHQGFTCRCSGTCYAECVCLCACTPHTYTWIVCILRVQHHELDGLCVFTAPVTSRAVQLPGIASVSVSLLTQQATVQYNTSMSTGPRDIIDRIEDAGFEAALAHEDGKAGLAGMKC